MWWPENPMLAFSACVFGQRMCPPLPKKLSHFFYIHWNTLSLRYKGQCWNIFGKIRVENNVEYWSCSGWLMGWLHRKILFSNFSFQFWFIYFDQFQFLILGNRFQIPILGLSLFLPILVNRFQIPSLGSLRKNMSVLVNNFFQLRNQNKLIMETENGNWNWNWN